MSKKIMSAVATSLALTLSLTACTSKDFIETEANIGLENPNEVVALRVWGSQEDQDLLNQLVEGFKQEYSEEASFDITVEVEDEMNCKYNILGDVSSAPDVFTFTDDQIMTFAAAGIIEPIIYSEEVMAENLEGAVEATTLNGEIYAYPLTADNGYFMYYNKDYFTEEDVKTLDRMLEVAEANNKQLCMDWSSGWYLYSFFGNTGLELGLNDDYVTNYCTWNSTSGEIKGVDVVKAMSQIASSKAFTNRQDTEFMAGVQDGTIIAGISGVWNAMEIEEAWGDAYAAVKLPTYTVTGKQVQMASYAGYKTLGVNSYSDNREWAEKLAQYLSNEQSQIERFKQRGQGPSNINAANSNEISESVAINALIQQSEFASIQRVGEFYWSAATELGEMLSNGELKGLTHQALIDDIVEKITLTFDTK